MPEDEQPDKVWDEYDWERFLQQQDKKTEKYMELLERYIDDPDRDQIIAREMGWNHLLNKEGQEWVANVDNQFDEELLDELDDGSEEGEDDTSFEVHPLYQAAFTLAAWIDQLLEDADLKPDVHPLAAKLSAHASLASAKLAAALSDDDIDELGMTIAYLKRALRGITGGLECAQALQKEKLLTSEQFGALNQQLFHVRDGIITLMGDYRAEWRRRFQR